MTNTLDKTQKRTPEQILSDEHRSSKRSEPEHENGQTTSRSDERQLEPNAGARSPAPNSESSDALQAWLNEKPHAAPWSSVIYHAKATGEKSS